MNSFKLVNGIFTISLDFELYWGVRDRRTVENYRENLLGVPQAIDGILDLFVEYNIHATWALVGMLYFGSNEELKRSLPNLQPSYLGKKKLSPYPYIYENDVLEEDFHFAQNIIDKIAATNYQEIATHTFSHYYANELGQSVEEFEADITQSIKIAAERGQKITTIVFPRNQCNSNYFSVLKKLGIRVYRGCDIHEALLPNNLLLKRIVRLADSYFNFTGDNCIDSSCFVVPQDSMINVCGSRFFRPYSKHLAFLEKAKLKRIKESMKCAAETNTLYHLWWHPHNFGKNLSDNLNQLDEILRYYQSLNAIYGFQTMNMKRVSECNDKKN